MLQHTTRRTVADNNGLFKLSDIPLVPGSNRLVFAVSDDAGNVRLFEREIIREERPQISVSLLHDTAQGGGEDDDLVSADPTLTGSVAVPAPSRSCSSGSTGRMKHRLSMCRIC